MHDWEQIIEVHGHIVWRHALRMLGNQNDAADCYQVVMLDAYELSQRQEIKNWPGLLTRLSAVRSLDALRQRYRHATVPLSGTSQIESEDLNLQRDSPDGPTQAQQLVERLRVELSRLPPLQAEAFTLRFIEDLPVSEVAERMQTDANHVGVLIHRARVALQSRLSREDF